MKKLRLTTSLFAALTVLGIMAFTAVAMMVIPIPLAYATEDGDGIIEPGENTTKELAKASQNPVSSLISVPFEFNSTFNNGPEDAFVENLLIKPVIPISISENWNLINRAIVPVIYREELFEGQGDVFGLGDINYQGFFSPKTSGKFTWGIGPILGLPTGMDGLTSNQWTLGPNAVGVIMPGHFVMGLLVSNVWNIGGGYDDPPDVNQLAAQYFINYNMEGGWYLSMAPNITANWEADSGDVWTVPFGIGVGRIFKIGKQHVNVNIKGYYSVWRPEDASDWNVQFQWSFLFPKKRK